MIPWRQIIPISISIAAMLAGFISIIKAAQGAYLVSAQLIMLSMILDGFDGNVARKLNGTTKFGGEFDTFVDIMSFGVAPALLAYLYALQSYPIFGLLLASSIVLSGMTRLSRFRVADPFRGQNGYLGMPITVNAAWIALTVFMAESSSAFTLDHGLSAVVVWGCSILFLLLQVSSLHYSKPTKHWIFIIPAALLVLALFMDFRVGFASAAGMCIYGTFYAFVSPFLPRRIDIVDPDDDDTISAES